LDASQEPFCPLSCQDNSKQLLSFGGAAGACNFGESGREWCSAVSGLDPDERKYPLPVAHSGQVMTYGCNTNHRVTNVRVHCAGTEIFWYADEYEKTTNRGMSPDSAVNGTRGWNRTSVGYVQSAAGMPATRSCVGSGGRNRTCVGCVLQRCWGTSNPHLRSWRASKELHPTSGLWRPVPRYEDRPKLAESGPLEGHAT